MSQDTIFYLCSDLLTSFSVIFFHYEDRNLLSGSFLEDKQKLCQFLHKLLEKSCNQLFLIITMSSFHIFFYVSSDIYTKALVSMYAFEVIGWNIFCTLQAGSSH